MNNDWMLDFCIALIESSWELEQLILIEIVISKNYKSTVLGQTENIDWPNGLGVQGVSAGHTIS